MSADLIQANYDQLEGVASHFDQQADNTTTMRSRIDQAVEALHGSWEGEGATAVFTEMDEVIFPALDRFRQALEAGGKTTRQIIEVVRTAEEEAARPFQGNGSGVASTGNDSGFWVGIKDFFGGMYDEGKDMVTGLWKLVTDPVGTAKGLWHGITHPGQLWDAFKQPYVEAWENGHPWRAIGRGTMFIGSILIGTKGADKAAEGAKVSRAARVAEEAVEIGAKYSNVADDVARAVGAVEKGSRAETAAARFIAEQSTHAYPGTLAERVVLGRYAADVSQGYLGYIGEAKAFGGRIFNTGDDIWRIVQPVESGGNGRIWAVNREFLQAQLEQGVPRIEVRGSSVQQLLEESNPINQFMNPGAEITYSAREVRYLQRHAYQYGYRLESNSWVKITDTWQASHAGRATGGFVSPGLDIINDTTP